MSDLIRKDTLTADDRQALEASLVNIIYQRAVQLYEPLEHGGHIVGSGHHMAQKVAAFAQMLLHERWNGDVVSQIGNFLPPDRVSRAIDAYATALVGDAPQKSTLEERRARATLEAVIETETGCERCYPRCPSCKSGDHIRCPNRPPEESCCCMPRKELQRVDGRLP